MNDVQNMQAGVGELLTAQQVQRMLDIDRSTVYRMAEDGRLPAIKVGRQWRFPADRISRMFATDTTASPDSATPPVPVPAQVSVPVGAGWSTSGAGPVTSSDPATSPGPASGGDDLWERLSATAEAVLSVSAELLGVMMVVTDMDGRPLTPVANPCEWFADRAGDVTTVQACTAEWKQLADDPDFGSRFHTGALGFQCTRAFVRSGSRLIGMVLAGGIAADGDDTPGLYRLDESGRRLVLAALPKVAAALSRAATAPAPAAEPDQRSAR